LLARICLRRARKGALNRRWCGFVIRAFSFWHRLQIGTISQDMVSATFSFNFSSFL
jgi:hypothetical protein